MTKKFTGTKLLLASGNQGKILEITQLLSDYNVQLASAKDFDIEEPEETGKTFVANAELKAKYYGDITGSPALADDSGLAVEALGGAPGIYSARWAGDKKDFKAAMQRVEKELNGSDNLNAKFVCALSLYWPDDKKFASFEGEVKGKLTFPPKGDKGFGYDPIFIPNGYDQTFGELSGDVKQNISHRADAFRKLINGCFK